MPTINFSGLASGIDSEALIDATREAREAVRITPKEEEIAELEAENTALDELKTLLTEFKDLLTDFTDLSGGGVAKTVTSTDETAVTAIAGNSANNGVYTINTIDQLATNHTLSFTTSGTISDTSADIITVGGQSGRMTIDIGSGPEETINIDVDENMSWDELVAEINTSTDLATAQMVNTAAPGSPEDYKLVITTSTVGTEKGSLSVDTNAQFGGSGNSDLDNYLNPDVGNEQAAQDAQFTLAGISGTITRSSNTVNDIIPGVTISLEDTSASPVTIQVQTDTATTESAVNSLVEKYNEIVSFIEENNTVTREEDGNEVENIFGPLANTRVDDGVLSALRSQIVASRYELENPLGGEALNSIRIFADLGIETERDGTLNFDTDDFQAAITSEPDSVKQILENFANATAKTGEVIEQYTRFNGLIDVTDSGNDDRIESLNDEIARAQEFIDAEATQIRNRFARLEALISNLQTQQQALTSALAGLGA